MPKMPTGQAAGVRNCAPIWLAPAQHKHRRAHRDEGGQRAGIGQGGDLVSGISRRRREVTIAVKMVMRTGVPRLGHSPGCSAAGRHGQR